MHNKEKLTEGIGKLLILKGQCQIHTNDDLGISDMSFKQLKQLQTFLGVEKMTTSLLADTLGVTKPTVTEMVKKFIKQGYLAKETCATDGRVHYLKLTDKGQKIASVNELVYSYLAERLNVQLDADDLDTLAKILNKIEV